ncbi:hypothetical protein GOV05_01305 [Candidatus Woesearchaeota archaeon]|nr:hypothetical protein [Candidatus Woesearchaeota archaeon]
MDFIKNIRKAINLGRKDVNEETVDLHVWVDELEKSQKKIDREIAKLEKKIMNLKQSW